MFDLSDYKDFFSLLGSVGGSAQCEIPWDSLGR